MATTITIASVDTDNDDFTASLSHALTNGDAVKMEAVVAPGGTVNGTLYYARVINTTKFTIHPTRADARNGINQIAISSAGTAVTFLVGDSLTVRTKRTITVNHPGTEPVPSTFSDYSRELVFVEGVDTDYSRLDVLHSTAMKLVFSPGVSSSPTYIYTDDAPKAAPGPEQIREYWYLT